MTARARALVAFGAYLCLAAQLMGVLHVLVVRHATCPGHGEMIHGGTPALAHTPPPAGRAVNGASTAAEEQDEHCLFVATRRREMAGLAPVSHGQLIVPDLSVTDAPAAPALVTVRALLRFAPKTSPPLAAV